LREVWRLLPLTLARAPYGSKNPERSWPLPQRRDGLEARLSQRYLRSSWRRAESGVRSRLERSRDIGKGMCFCGSQNRDCQGLALNRFPNGKPRTRSVTQASPTDHSPAREHQCLVASKRKRVSPSCIRSSLSRAIKLRYSELVRRSRSSRSCRCKIDFFSASLFSRS